MRLTKKDGRGAAWFTLSVDGEGSGGKRQASCKGRMSVTRQGVGAWRRGKRIKSGGSAFGVFTLRLSVVPTDERGRLSL